MTKSNGCVANAPLEYEPKHYLKLDQRSTNKDDGRSIVWLDIDNTLYSQKSGIPGLMAQLIQAYFRRLGLNEDEAKTLHRKYYAEHGLAIRGLVKNHDIDPIEYDRLCDGSLPLEDILHPDPVITRLLQDIDPSKARIWALTNAYKNHGTRVLEILKLTNLIEGIVYCDYAENDFACKPEAKFYNEAKEATGVFDESRQYFVDDSLTNIKGAYDIGWLNSVLYDELESFDKSSEKRSFSVIKDLDELRTAWPELFKSSTT